LYKIVYGRSSSKLANNRNLPTASIDGSSLKLAENSVRNSREGEMTEGNLSETLREFREYFATSYESQGKIAGPRWRDAIDAFGLVGR
jgi:hypothetical protein